MADPSSARSSASSRASPTARPCAPRSTPTPRTLSRPPGSAADDSERSERLAALRPALAGHSLEPVTADRQRLVPGASREVEAVLARLVLVPEAAKALEERAALGLPMARAL